MGSLNTIPNEIILHILDNFECTSDLKIAKAICKKWRDSVNYFMKTKCKYICNLFMFNLQFFRLKQFLSKSNLGNFAVNNFDPILKEKIQQNCNFDHTKFGKNFHFYTLF